MEVPLLDLKAQYATIRDKVKAAVDEVLESQRFILGSNVSWTFAGTGLENTYVQTLVIDPADPAILYAGTMLGGIFKSIDGGQSWNSVWQPARAVERLTTAVLPTKALERRQTVGPEQ